MKELFFYVWFTLTEMLTPGAVYKKIDHHPAMKRCRYKKMTFQVSGLEIRGYYIPGIHPRTLYITGGVHGSERVGVLVAVNLLLNLCMLSNSQDSSVFIIPIANPHGYARRRGSRWGKRGQDLNRDAFLQKEPESSVTTWAFRSLPVVRYIDLHMTGNVLLSPRRWTRGYKPSLAFASRLRRVGLKFPVLQGSPNGMLVSYASERGIPSVLIEAGRRGSHLKLKDRSLHYEIALRVLCPLFLLLQHKFTLPAKKDLRKKSPRSRLKRYEASRWRSGFRSSLKHVLPWLPKP